MSYWKIVFFILWFLTILPALAICDVLYEHVGFWTAVVVGFFEVLSLAGFINQLV